MKEKSKRRYLFYLVPYIFIDVIIFLASYLYNKSFSLYAIVLTSFLTSIIVISRLKITVPKKIIFILVASILNIFIVIALLLSAMFIPGSKEHNYVMYTICFPAIKKYYKVPVDQPIPSDGRVDKDGWGKWWYQHVECEQNVYAGKGPVFSENPPGFIPVTK